MLKCFRRDFLRVKTKQSHRTFPVETSGARPQTSTYRRDPDPEDRNSNPEESCSHMVLHTVNFYNSGDRVPGIRVVETKRTHAQQQGCVTFLWQCWSEGACHQTAPVLPFRQKNSFKVQAPPPVTSVSSNQPIRAKHLPAHVTVS